MPQDEGGEKKTFAKSRSGIITDIKCVLRGEGHLLSDVECVGYDFLLTKYLTKWATI